MWVEKRKYGWYWYCSTILGNTYMRRAKWWEVILYKLFRLPIIK